MKKILCLIIILLVAGCNKIINTPTKKVEDFFSKYQTLDNEVISELEENINSDLTLTDDGKKKYIDIMKKHYQNLKYEIKDEIIDGDEAIVKVLITVTDYSKIIYGENNEIDNLKELNDERLSKMENSNDTISYTLEISLILIDKEWRINDLSDTDYLKISGLYGY